MKFKRIAIDTSKHVFTLHGVDEQERPVLRRELKRAQVEGFFAKQEATEVVLEACGGSHQWGRLLSRLGHRVRLIAPQYVKPFVRRAKNDRNDAEAISEAASRPTMRSVVVKTVDQQAGSIILKHREMLVGQRTQAINALRGHAAEFGVVAAKGLTKVAPVPGPCSRGWASILRRWIIKWRLWMTNWRHCTRPTRSASCWPRSPASVRWARSP
jgi:transposase